MRRKMTGSLGVVVGLAMLGAVAAPAQQQPVPERPAAPGGAPARPAPPGSLAPAPKAPQAPQERQIEGTVKKVDPLEKTVGISSGFFGLLGTTVRVADDTQIRVEGKPATLAEIKAGAKVKASYEVRDGEKLAKSIEVMPVEAKTRPAA